ncbi:MAG: carbonic anhydrase [Desulfobaccales bacterium]
MAHSATGITGKEVWRQLLEGNRRFVHNQPLTRNLPELNQSLIGGQHPKAAVLCCSDSRVPPEIIFDQSLGDIFVVRTAGLVLDPTTLGSLEYAVAHLHVPLLVVKGHEFCGAVTAAVHHPDLDEGHITAVVQKIAPAVTRGRQSGLVGGELVETVNDLHLKSLYDDLGRLSPIIQEALAGGRLDLVVGKYFLSTGRVELMAATF